MTPPAPAEPPPTSNQPTCWNNTRQEIRSWLRRNAPSLAELYEGAVMLLYTNPLPGRVRFIAHAVREIRNRLPDAIAGPTKRQYLDYTNRLDDITKLPSARALIANLGGKTPTKTIAIDRQLAKKIANLLQDHLITREKRLDATRRLFEGLAPENTPLRDTLTPVIQQWFNTTEAFMKKTHDAGLTDEHCPEAELRHQFTIFETALAAVITPFFDTLEELDAILENANN